MRDHSLGRKLLVGALLLCLTAGCLPARAEAEKSLTVMIYLTGSNLESLDFSASQEIQEMEAAGIDARRMAVVVMAGGAKQWGNGLQAEKNVILEIGNGRRRIVHREPERNMGDPETLSFFLHFASKEYPADEYALILWDHGGGPLLGVCFDELHKKDGEMDSLSLSELRSALESSPFRERRLSWIGFDACLMATLETACTVAPYAEYMIASQELETKEGWNYSFLEQALEAGGDTIGRLIADRYMDERKNLLQSATLSVIDLKVIREMAGDLSAFFGGITLSENNYPNYARGRSRVKKIAQAVPAGYDLVDLMDLLKKWQESGTADSSEIRMKLEKAILYNRSNTSSLNGLSVYFPFQNKTMYLDSWRDLYQRASFSEGYSCFLTQYTDIWTGESLTDWDTPHLLSQQTIENEALFSMQLTPEQAAQFASARLVVLSLSMNNEYWSGFFTYASEDVGLTPEGILSASYQGQALFMTDGDGNRLSGALAYDALPDGEIGLRAILGHEDFDERAVQFLGLGLPGERQSVYLVYHPGTDGRFRLAAVYPLEDENDQIVRQDQLIIGKSEVRLEDWEKILFINPERTANQFETFTAFENWNRQYSKSELLPIQEMIPAFLTHYDERDRYAYLEMRDLQDNVICSQLFPIENQNSLQYRAENSLLLETESVSLILKHVDLSRQVFIAENRSEHQITLRPEDVYLDWVYIPEPSPPVVVVPPQTRMQFTVNLPSAVLKMNHLNRLNEIRVTLTGIAGGETLFREETIVPVHVDWSKWTELPEETILSTVEAGSLRMELQGIDYSLNGTMTARLHIINTGNQDVSFSMQNDRFWECRTYLRKILEEMKKLLMPDSGLKDLSLKKTAERSGQYFRLIAERVLSPQAHIHYLQNFYGQESEIWILPARAECYMNIYIRMEIPESIPRVRYGMAAVYQRTHHVSVPEITLRFSKTGSGERNDDAVMFVMNPAYNMGLTSIFPGKTISGEPLYDKTQHDATAWITDIVYTEKSPLAGG